MENKEAIKIVYKKFVKKMEEHLQYAAKWKDSNKKHKYNMLLAIQKQHKLLTVGRITSEL